MFLIVEFEGKEIGVVPASWTDGDSHVKWPPYKSSQRINSAVQRKEPPSDSWSVEPIVRVLYRNGKKHFFAHQSKFITVLWYILAVVNYWPISPPGSKGRKLKTPKYDPKNAPVVGDIYIF